MHCALLPVWMRSSSDAHCSGLEGRFSRARQCSVRLTASCLVSVTGIATRAGADCNCDVERRPLVGANAASSCRSGRWAEPSTSMGTDPVASPFVAAHTGWFCTGSVSTMFTSCDAVGGDISGSASSADAGCSGGWAICWLVVLSLNGATNPNAAISTAPLSPGGFTILLSSVVTMLMRELSFSLSCSAISREDSRGVNITLPRCRSKNSFMVLATAGFMSRVSLATAS
mmetsp:Transcript_75715/g.127344  ORF Transcript_75715/g.127344 Transcript_75715/m.127344 type:complete len:229 (-) Transcript_75715:1291-1977(-)